MTIRAINFAIGSERLYSVNRHEFLIDRLCWIFRIRSITNLWDVLTYASIF